MYHCPSNPSKLCEILKFPSLSLVITVNYNLFSVNLPKPSSDVNIVFIRFFVFRTC